MTYGKAGLQGGHGLTLSSNGVWGTGVHPPQETADAHNLELGNMLDDAGMVGTTTPAGGLPPPGICISQS